MSIWPETKYALNGTIGTGYKESLDQLLGAKIVCRGHIGTKFTITRADGYYAEKTAEITENSKLITDRTYDDLRAEIVPVPCGTYAVKIEANGVEATASVSAATVGQHYTFSYENVKEVAKLTASGTFTVPKGVRFLFVSAIGGGGGGGGASGGAGGGGGGAGIGVKLKKIEVEGLDEIPVTIGTGGTGGTTRQRGESGTATIIGNFFTVNGGGGGAGGVSGTSVGSGGVGGASGGNGGYGYRRYVNGGYVSNYPNAGASGGKNSTFNTNGGSGGSEGEDGTSNCGGGGGGGGMVTGGGGGNRGSDGYSGSQGSGGGGASGYSYSERGGKGGDGIAIFYKGVKVV